MELLKDLLHYQMYSTFSSGVWNRILIVISKRNTSFQSTDFNKNIYYYLAESGLIQN